MWEKNLIQTPADKTLANRNIPKTYFLMICDRFSCFSASEDQSIVLQQHY